MRLLLVAMLVMVLAGCSRLSNKIDRVELDCGESGDLNEFRYVKLQSEKSEFMSKSTLQVTNEDGEDLNSFLTSKGCLRIPLRYKARIIVARPSSNEGQVFFPLRLQLGNVNSLLMKNFRYQSVDSTCKNFIATSASAIRWPIDFQSVDGLGFLWKMQIKRNGKPLIEMKRTAFEDINREMIDIGSLSDGTYQMEGSARQLFSSDALESKFNCDLIVDRSAPFVSMNANLIDAEGTVQAGPGEAIRIITSADGSNETIFSCLRPSDQPASTCTYDQLSGGYLTAPQAGDWNLSLYAVDAAGNQSRPIDHHLQIFDNNLIAVINGYTEQATLAQRSGSGLYAMIKSIKAYEKMKSLTSKAEIASVINLVKRTIFESFSMPVEEYLMKAVPNVAFSALGTIQKDGVPLFVYERGTNQYELRDTHGNIFGDLIDWAKVLDAPAYLVSAYFCAADGTMFARSDKTLVIYKNGREAKRIPLDKSIASWETTQVSLDCSYALVKDIGVDLRTYETFPMKASQGLNALGRVFIGGKEKILQTTYGLDFLAYDRVDGRVEKLGDLLGVGAIEQVKMARNGGLGILTSDRRLTVFSSAGEKLSSTEQVVYFDKTTLDNELIVLSKDNILKSFSTLTGAQVLDLPFNEANPSFLNANGEFIVFMNVGSSIVNVWTRTGNPYDEIYNKNDSVRSVWLSREGYLSVDSNQYAKLFKLNNQLSRKKVPPRWLALGLEYAPDGQSLVYKAQDHKYIDREFQPFDDLVSWNLETDQTTIFKLDPTVNNGTSIAPPNDQTRTRDIAYFQQDGVQYLAIAVKRGSVSIFRADDLSHELKTIFFSDQWILDIAIDPAGERIAAITQGNGLIYVKNLRDPSIGGTQNVSSFANNVAFDKTGETLYITDAYGRLSQYAVGLDPDSPRYIFQAPKNVDDAGIIFALNGTGDRLAVVGKGATLNLYDANLKFIRSFELSKNSINQGQSVVFSPDGTKIYASVFDGTWNEVDLKTGKILQVRFSSTQAGARHITVNPQGDSIAFVGGGFVQIADLNVDRVYQKICTWLKPRLASIPDLSAEESSLCAATP